MGEGRIGLYLFIFFLTHVWKGEILMSERIAVTIVDGRPEGYVTAKEFAVRHGVGESAVRIWLYRKKLKVLKIGNQIWIDENTKKPTRAKRKRMLIKGYSVPDFQSIADMVLLLTDRNYADLAKATGFSEKKLYAVMGEYRKFITMEDGVAIFQALKDFVEKACANGECVDPAHEILEEMRAIVKC